MPIQRSRRAVLGRLGSAGLVGAAGCLGRRETVSLLAAGSLAHAVEDHVGPAFEAETGVAVHGEYYGSNAVLRMVEDRTKHPDVVVSADATLLRDRLYGEFVDWDVEFATNVLGVGYDPDTTFGSGLAVGEPWYELVPESAAGDVVVGDPDLDPLGYRALQAFDLAEREHGLDGFRDAVVDLVSREPDETQMLAGVASGARAGAVCYRNMAVDRGLPFVAFPPAYNFAEPALADHYATAVVTTGEEGATVEGRPILYNAAVLDGADAPAEGRRLVQFLVDNPDVLVDAGLAVAERLPRAAGDAPEGLAG